MLYNKHFCVINECKVTKNMSNSNMFYIEKSHFIYM